ncbi:Protein kinase protein rad53 [Taxawa tesnikishii (nom. ined.)]|nr:Protein kinase protein rad53 [Dothideales sp. JES 119]
MEDDEATQPTQATQDPRRRGVNNSGLSDADVGDILCILHPCSPAAFNIVARTAQRAPQHVLQAHGSGYFDDGLSQAEIEEQETFVLEQSDQYNSLDLALRFSAHTVNPASGFVFGRNPAMCDIVFDTDSAKRGYMLKVAHAEAMAQAANHGKMLQHLPGGKAANTAPFGAANARGVVSALRPPLMHDNFGMRWNGGAKYNPVGLLGKGAFATVYRIATKRDGQFFAVKELEKRRFMKNGVLDRKLENELQIMKGINHPNIVQYVEYEETAHDLYIIMEYVPCGDLQQYLSMNGPLPEQLGKAVAEQVFDAMAYLHRKRITHRDIKPDNILIASDDPTNFQIKLSDFGLSKVVKDNETFLKTFCGTLLYCAPEVFPHYDAHIAAKGGKKRAHRGQRRAHPNSIPTPPFEGVADATGRGMFDKIMMTQLDPTPLLEQGVSREAISLLASMLNTDPSERPLPSHCLQHPWFGNGKIRTTVEPLESGLSAINEEEEAEAGAEPDMSQLSLHENANVATGRSDEVSLDSDDLNFLDPRQSKRFKAQEAKRPWIPPRIREGSPTQTGAELDMEEQDDFDLASSQQPQRARPRLFGEIGQSALASSGVLGKHTNHALSSVVDTSTGISQAYYSSDFQQSEERNEEPFATAVAHQSNNQTSVEENYEQARPDSFTIALNSDHPVGSPSLEGAESLVRGLNMESPQSANSPAADPSEPTTPKTPDEIRPPSLSQADASEETPTRQQEETPKQRVTTFNRQINLPIPASFFFDPNDPSTHTLEYASEVSGHNFATNGPLSAADFPSLPATMTASNTDPGTPGSTTTDTKVQLSTTPMLQPAPEFARPAPRLGRLTTTADSFTSITLNLSSRITTWGRMPSNTFVYPDKLDTRIPKRGITLYFYGQSVEQLEQSGEDWTKMPDLHCVIATDSSLGIFINGVKLRSQDEQGRRLYGKVYTGDEIGIYGGQGPDGKPMVLKFVCEFFHGEGKQTREEAGTKFEVKAENRAAASSQ